MRSALSYQRIISYYRMLSVGRDPKDLCLILTTIWWLSGPWDVFLIICYTVKTVPNAPILLPGVAEARDKSFFFEELITDKCFSLSISILCQGKTRLFFRELVSLILLACSFRIEQMPEFIQLYLQSRNFSTQGLVNLSSLLSDVWWFVIIKYTVIICRTEDNILFQELQLI